MTQKLVSIVLATRNCGPKVEGTIRSILSQNRDLFELLVIDGASTDGTTDLIRKYSSELTLVCEIDKGIYDAFNKGIDLSTGRYIYFIGAGDALRPGILEEIKSMLPTDVPTLLYGSCFFKQQKYVNGREFNSRLFIKNNICHQGMFFHRDIFRLVGQYDPNYKVFADWLLNLKCFLEPLIRTRFIDAVIADFEQGGVSSDIGSDPRFKRDFPCFVRKHLGLADAVVCKLFLTEPFIFNCIRTAEYQSLFNHLVENYSWPKHAYKISRSFRHLVKGTGTETGRANRSCSVSKRCP